ncbi:MAG: hypothetical protein HY507_02165 [Candidatus Zambryskibacteria bacterium]|nr:hypothetical protein [Candidatus Zambryskibacteria bacterium]
MPKNNSVVRTTVVFSEAIADNIKFYALKNGKTEAEVIREALVKFFQDAGQKPDKRIIGVEAKYAD